MVSYHVDDLSSCPGIEVVIACKLHLGAQPEFSSAPALWTWTCVGSRGCSAIAIKDVRPVAGGCLDRRWVCCLP